jgi:2-keto-4-pentenoate hydratase/2-oxohepta-3-ene-1,7-dioic acid hydratase in catechol pathway
MGPFVYAGADMRDASIKLWQNGELRQSTRTSRMIHPVAEIISFVSQSLTLSPGDVILTGTPAGVGPIQAGDQLEAEIEAWPRLHNSVANAQKISTDRAERTSANTI